MGSNPINLTIRFLLELAALAIMGIWAWRLGEGWMQYLLAFGMPLIAATVWGIFAVPEDPSRSGKAPVPVSGFIRLLIELTVFGFTTWALYDMGNFRLSMALGIIVLVHYIVSYDRIKWLMSNKK